MRIGSRSVLALVVLAWLLMGIPRPPGCRRPPRPPRPPRPELPVPPPQVGELGDRAWRSAQAGRVDQYPTAGSTTSASGSPAR